jgi:hypothetical protein
METLRVCRLQARYRMAAYAVNERARLDRVLRTAAKDMLGVALDRSGVGRHEIVCLRGVHLRSRLLLSLSDDALAAEWSLQMAEAIREAASLRGAAVGSEAAVRYRSRAAALDDLLCSVLRRDYSRAWAWRQLGFWPDSEAPSDRLAVQWTVEALVNDAETIVPLLAAAARHGLFRESIRRFEIENWAALAEAALTVFHRNTEATLEAESVAPEIECYVASALNRSSLLHAIPSDIFGSELLSAIARPLAILAILEGDATLAARPKIVADAAAALAAKLRARKPLPVAQRDPEALESAVATERGDGRAPVQTSFGGLLYLLNVVADLELWKRLLDPEGARTIAWGLHQLGVSILSRADRSRTVATHLSEEAEPAHHLDPAVLAFAGSGAHPDLDEPAASEEEQQRIDECAAGIVHELERRMPATEVRGDAMVDWVCRRRCILLYDPGWIAAHFSLDNVSTDIRRARLDLNPGYLPWLGTTVMFVYE